MSELTQIYQAAIKSVQNKPPLSRIEKQNPKEYIVATHGPALTQALIEKPELLNLIGIYRVNCSHLGKESDIEMLAEYLRTLHPHVSILIDLQ